MHHRYPACKQEAEGTKLRMVDFRGGFSSGSLRENGKAALPTPTPDCARSGTLSNLYVLFPLS